MAFPHEKSFTFRQPSFWGLSILGVLLGLRTPGLTLWTMAGGIALAAGAAWTVFRYTRWLVRIDGEFRDANPYKIRVTTLAAFYGSLIMGVAVLLVGAWLPANPAKSALENASPLFFVPTLFASAAGALHGGRESGVIE